MKTPHFTIDLASQQVFLAEIWGINDINNTYMRVFHGHHSPQARARFDHPKASEGQRDWGSVGLAA